MVSSSRGEFSSRLGFVMAAAGSAVGLGNIWGFPTQAASNGGAAFLIVYLLLAFTLAYPALMAELIIGRHAHGNAVKALRHVSSNRVTRALGGLTGRIGVLVASLILAFYGIVAGWMFAHALAAVARLAGATSLEAWLTGFSLPRNLSFLVVFMGLTALIISQGVKAGIERWSTRLMPTLLVMLVGLALYVLTLDGAMDGLKVYLLPDFERALAPDLIIRALGSAFFSLSLGVGTMLIYGSYISDRENLPVLGGMVTLVDIGIAVLAGFLVLPAMYVALAAGVPIFADDGSLLAEDTLIFTVLPALFDSMGAVGSLVALAFFALMSIAALTSSISMLEVPVAYAIEEHSAKRGAIVWIVTAAITVISTLILLNFEWLFGLVITITTRYSQPLLGFMMCVYAGWLWQRDSVLQELRKGAPDIEHGWFWRIWPSYVRWVCPAIILLIFVHSLR